MPFLNTDTWALGKVNSWTQSCRQHSKMEILLAFRKALGCGGFGGIEFLVLLLLPSREESQPGFKSTATNSRLKRNLQEAGRRQDVGWG